jgi:hypothetical protein
LFFPEHENGRVKVKVDDEAVAACERCPVLEQCRDWAIKHEQHGYQGGLTEQQRAQIRRKLNIFLWEPQHNITAAASVKTLRSITAPIEHGTQRGYKQELRRGVAHCAACSAAHAAQAAASKRKKREAARGQ